MQLRGRLLTQLNELDIETADRNMDVAVIGDERQRLEAELAQMLRRLESLTTSVPQVTAPVFTPRAEGDADYIGYSVAARGHRALCWQAGKTIEQLLQLGPGGQPDPLKDGGAVGKAIGKRARRSRRLGAPRALVRGVGALRRCQAGIGPKATQLAPDDAAILTEYATLLISGNPRAPSREAIAAFTRLYQLNPKHPGALGCWGSMPTTPASTNRRRSTGKDY